jgi:hypothetical protein
MTIRISVTSKLDGVRSWSLEAGATCPASKLPTGEWVPACAGCYARPENGNRYGMPNVREPRRENREDWSRDAWCDEMVATLANDRYFRWFDSGDMYALALAEKILEVMARTPWVKHWLPTRMEKFPKFAEVIARMRALPNVMVRFSSDEVDGSFTPGVHGSCIVPSVDAELENGVQLCAAAHNGGKCGPCRACYSKEVPVIAYVAHGRGMLKQIRVAVERKAA